MQQIQVEVLQYKSWEMFCPQCGYRVAMANEGKSGGMQECKNCNIEIQYYLKITGGRERIK